MKTVGVSRGNYLPAYTYVKLVYRSDLNTYNLAAGESRLFSMNSMFDPDVSGAGGQPSGFDQMALMYNNYQVYGCSIEATFSNGQSGAVGISEALVATSNTNVVGAWDQYEDQAGTKRRMITALGSSGSVRKIRMFRRVRRVLGLNRKQFGDANYGPLVSANPATQAYWVIYVRPFDRTTAPTITGSVKLTYYAKFYRPKRVPADA